MRLTTPSLPSSSVLIIALLLFLLPLFLLEYPLLMYSHGIFIYPYDEAYIRMAIGKNLASHGVWGLSGAEFSSASSSVLYPLMLSGFYKLFGLWSGVPFLINFIAAIVLICVLQQWLSGQGLNSWQQLLILVTVILLTPLPVLVLTGMEHGLQVLFTMIFLLYFNEWIRQEPWKIYVLGVLLTSVRYEGLFVVLVACIWLLCKRRFFTALTFGIISILPLVLFGIYSVNNGHYFLPSSVLMKALPMPLDWGSALKFLRTDVFTRLVYPFNTPGSAAAGRILILVPILYWLFFARLREQPLYRNILLFCLAIAIQQLVFAIPVLFFRYEAYLVTIALFITAVLWVKFGKGCWPEKGGGSRWVAIWMVLLLLAPFLRRGWLAFTDAGTDCLYFCGQGYQEGAFLRRYYDGATVVTDDIGVVSYLGDGKVMDLYRGIGYFEVAKAREQSYDRLIYISYLIKKEKPRLAIVEENRYPAELFRGWIKVADMSTKIKLPLRNSRLSFYVPEKSDSAGLHQNLRAFEPLLPMGVRMVYP